MINSDICATCEFIDQNEGCEGCNDENGSMGWVPTQDILEYFGDDCHVYSEFNWSIYGCFSCFDVNNSACAQDDCSLSVVCEKRTLN